MSSPNPIHYSGWAAPERKQPVPVLGSVCWSVLIAITFFGLNFLIQDGCLGDVPKHVISAPMFTDSVENGVDRQSQTETAYMYPSLSLEEILRRFSDARIDPANRRLFAYRLA